MVLLFGGRLRLTLESSWDFMSLKYCRVDGAKVTQVTTDTSLLSFYSSLGILLYENMNSFRWYYLEVLALLESSSSVCGCSFGFGFRGLLSPGSLKIHHRQKIISVDQTRNNQDKQMPIKTIPPFSSVPLSIKHFELKQFQVKCASVWLKCLELKQGRGSLTWRPEW